MSRIRFFSVIYFNFLREVSHIVTRVAISISKEKKFVPQKVKNDASVEKESLQHLRQTSKSSSAKHPIVHVNKQNESEEIFQALSNRNDSKSANMNETEFGKSNERETFPDSLAMPMSK